MGRWGQREGFLGRLLSQFWNKLKYTKMRRMRAGYFGKGDNWIIFTITQDIFLVWGPDGPRHSLKSPHLEWSETDSRILWSGFIYLWFFSHFSFRALGSNPARLVFMSPILPKWETCERPVYGESCWTPVISLYLVSSCPRWHRKLQNNPDHWLSRMVHMAGDMRPFPGLMLV